jgi:adenine-specific DNA-methyltransferase
MDFFSGSATTAEAVFRYVSKHKECPVSFIMVQLPENMDESVKAATSRAKKTFENAIKILRWN